MKNEEIKLRKESLFIVSSDLQNFRSWNGKGISSVLSSRNLAARVWCSDGTRNGDIFFDFNTELLITSNMCRRHYRK